MQILPNTVPAHGGPKCNPVKTATQKSSTSFSLRSCMERGPMGSFARGRPRRRTDRPLWFEDGSPFLARLSAELHDIPHKITPLLWSGANSIFVRDEAAHVLAEHLSAEHTEHPQATQLVIAHSHGGNIALRALHHLQQRDASQACGADRANPLVVTLATPFIEVHQADFGPRPYFIRAVRLIFALSLCSSLPAIRYFLSPRLGTRCLGWVNPLCHA